MKKRTSNLSNIRGVLYPRDPLFQKPRTTMSGLPWEVRHNATGTVKFPEKRAQAPRPRMGTYVYTYGLPEPENEQHRQPIPQPVKPHEPEFAGSIHRYLRANQALGKSDYTPSLTALMKETGNSLSPSPSTRDLIELEALWDDIRDDTKSATVTKSDSVTSSELSEAAEAFNLPGKSVQELQKPEKFSLTHPKKHSIDQKTRESIREIFPRPQRLHPDVQEKIIDEQVKKEFASKRIVPSQTDYVKRKEQLMKAVMLSGYNEESTSTDPVFPDVVQEYNYADLFNSQPSERDVHVLRRPTYTQSQDDPKRHIQVLSPPMIDPKNLNFRRRKESVIGMAMREVETSRGELSEQAAELPQRKRTKDEERKRQLAMRAMENYRLVQDRQKAVIHRLPQITVRSPSVQIPKGSAFHQVAIGHFHQTHPKPPMRIPTLKLSDVSRFKSPPVTSNESRNALLIRQDQKYPIHGVLDIPPPPPISETVFPKQRKYSKYKN